MLGLCPFIGLSRRLDVAVGVGLATTVVLTFSSAAAWLINDVLPSNFTAIQPLIFIALAAFFVQAAELFMRLYFIRMHRMLGVYLPLIATNCAVLAIMLLVVRNTDNTFTGAVAQGFGGGLGFMLAVLCLALVRERIIESKTPIIMRGAPLTMITAGWMALAFSGLTNAFT